MTSKWAQFLLTMQLSNGENDENHEDTDTRTYYFHVKFKILQQSGPQWMYVLKTNRYTSELNTTEETGKGSS